MPGLLCPNRGAAFFSCVAITPASEPLCGRHWPLVRVALVFIVFARIESVEQAGLRLRRDVVAAQVEPEAPVRRAVGPRTGLRLGGILGKPIGTVVIFVGGPGRFFPEQV